MNALPQEWPVLDADGVVRFTGLEEARTNAPQLTRGVLVVRGTVYRPGPRPLRLVAPRVGLDLAVSGRVVASAAGISVLTFPPCTEEMLAPLWRDPLPLEPPPPEKLDIQLPVPPELHRAPLDEAELSTPGLAFRTEISGSFSRPPLPNDPPPATWDTDHRPVLTEDRCVVFPDSVALARYLAQDAERGVLVVRPLGSTELGLVQELRVRMVDHAVQVRAEARLHAQEDGVLLEWLDPDHVREQLETLVLSEHQGA